MNKHSHSIPSNDQPVAKKPKLDVDRQLGRSSPFATSDSGDLNEFWNVWDNVDFDQIDEDVTIALSQDPKKIKYNKELQQCNNSYTETTVERENTKTELVGKRLTPSRYNSCVPLRRTASSGWPTVSTFSQVPQSDISTKNLHIHDTSSFQGNVKQLVQENNTLKEKLTRQTGEVTLIRDRLKNVQQECDKHKKEYTDKIAAIKEEADRSAVQLAKEIKSLKGQLEVKTMEMETVERRTHHVTSVNRLNPDSPRSKNLLSSGIQLARDNQLMSRRGHMQAKHYNYTLNLLKQVLEPALTSSSWLDSEIADSSYSSDSPNVASAQTVSMCRPSTSHTQVAVSGSVDSTRVDFTPTATMAKLLSVPCLGVGACRLSLLSPTLLDINSENAHYIITKVTKSCIQILTMTHQLMATSSKKPCLERRRDKAVLTIPEPLDLLSHKSLFSAEKGICARRALVLQSLVVEFSSFAAELVLPSFTLQGQDDNLDKEENAKINNPMRTADNEDTRKLLIIVKDIVHLIKIQKTQLYEGFLAAVLLLLKSLLLADVVLPPHGQDLIVQLLQGVVYTRPGSLVVYFSLCVLTAATKYPQITESLCNNSDKCVLQNLCTQLHLSKVPNKHLLSELFTSWVLSLFYAKGMNSPKWLFSVPNQKVCQCRPLISRLCLTMLGEACADFPTADTSRKRMLENLLKRGVQLVYTLLYQDEHFGANVDPPSEGNYEFFIYSMNSFLETQELKLDEALSEILETLSIQELKQPTHISELNENPLYEMAAIVTEGMETDYT